MKINNDIQNNQKKDRFRMMAASSIVFKNYDPTLLQDKSIVNEKESYIDDNLISRRQLSESD